VSTGHAAGPSIDRLARVETRDEHLEKTSDNKAEHKEDEDEIPRGKEVHIALLYTTQHITFCVHPQKNSLAGVFLWELHIR
jgi:hypothetical protein